MKKTIYIFFIATLGVLLTAGCSNQNSELEKDFANYIAKTFWDSSGEIQQQELCTFWVEDENETRNAFVSAYNKTGDAEFLPALKVWSSLQVILSDNCESNGTVKS